MSEDQRARRADVLFRVIILMLAGLWLLFPPAHVRPAEKPVATTGSLR